MEKKLSEMILNHSFFGILDQGEGILEVYEGSQDDGAYKQGVEVIANMEMVVDNLFERVRSLNNGTSSVAPVAASTA